MDGSRYNNGLAAASCGLVSVAGKSNEFGLVAQLVEQRTENPCVGGSIPPQATNNMRLSDRGAVFLSAVDLSRYQRALCFTLKRRVGRKVGSRY